MARISRFRAPTQQQNKEKHGENKKGECRLPETGALDEHKAAVVFIRRRRNEDELAPFFAPGVFRTS
jgi:hypothetical protein